MKKNQLQPGRSAQGCIGKITGDDLWHMEDVLFQDALPYDPLRPLIGFDDRPCLLIGDVGAILPMSPGKAQRYHYAYEQHGSCCVLLAFEPHTGRRYGEVRARRTAVDDAECRQNLIATHSAQVECMRLVQDTLHTHTPGSLYEVVPPSDACQLSQRFEPHDTPLQGSWLTMAEIEFAALAKQCLDRRIPTLDLLDRAVRAWADRRHLERKTVHWRCTPDDARDTCHRHYRNVQKFM